MKPKVQSGDGVILVVDDREDDVLLTKQALVRANVSNPVHVACDGEEAIQYLEGTGKFGNRDEYPLPDLVLLDLNMPKVDGFEVLQWIRSHPVLRNLRTIVLTTSERLNDINRAYELGANSFVVKAPDFKNYCRMMETTMAFWLKLSRAPSLQRPAAMCNS